MRRARTDNSVELTKTVNVSGDVVRVTYRIAVADDDAEQVRLVETLPEPVPRSAITCSAHDDGHWERSGDRELVFVSDVPDAEFIRATLRLESASVDPEDCMSSVTLLPDGLHGHRRGGISRPARTNGHSADASPPPVDAPEDGELPAVGLVATDGNVDAVARTTVRATERGHAVFLAAADDEGTAARVGRRLGATVVELDSESAVAADIAATAQRGSSPGVIFCGAPDGRIAFDESVAAFDSSADAVVEPVWEADEPSVLVGIPAYNEAETVGEVVAEAREYADEVLVVDDGSTDRTPSRAREAGAAVVEHERNRGYGHTLKTLFVEADSRDADLLVTLDADGQHAAEDVHRLVEKQRESSAELVIGSRFGDAGGAEMPTYRRLGLWVITRLTNLSIGDLGEHAGIRDPQSGFRAYDATAIAALADHADALDDQMSASIDVLSVAHECGFTAAEVPISISYDVANANTRNPVSHGMDVVNKVRKTLQRNRPVTVFGVPGVCLALTGVGVSHWALSNYLTRGTVSLELTLLAALLILTGTLSSFLSVVRHSLNTHLDAVALWNGD